METHPLKDQDKGTAGPAAFSRRSPSPTSRFRIARTVWWLLTLALILLYASSIPGFYRNVSTLNIPERAANVAQFAEAAKSLNGYPPTTVAVIVLAIDLLTLGIFLFVAYRILSRNRSRVFPIFVAYFLVLIGTAFTADIVIAGRAEPTIQDLLTILSEVGWISFYVFIFTFPNGRFIPRWTVVPLVTYLPLAVIMDLFDPSWLPEIPVYLLPAIPLLALFSQAYRYRKVATIEERQQTKWVLAAVGGIIIISTPLLFIGPDFVSASTIPSNIAFWMIPISIGFAINRYRLWDVDTLFNRALVYGALTTALAGIFAASVALVSQVSQQLLGADSKALAAAISAGLVAILFEPLRDRLDTRLSKRFLASQQALTTGLIEAEPGFWPFISLDDFMEATAWHVSQAMNCTPVSIYLSRGQNQYQPAFSLGIPLAELTGIEATSDQRTAWASKRASAAGRDKFSVLAPIFLPGVKGPEVIGLLALGSRLKGRGYSGYDLKALVEFGARIGPVIHALRMKTSRSLSPHDPRPISQPIPHN